jgi:hypothetical protein
MELMIHFTDVIEGSYDNVKQIKIAEQFKITNTKYVNLYSKPHYIETKDGFDTEMIIKEIIYSYGKWLDELRNVVSLLSEE